MRPRCLHRGRRGPHLLDWAAGSRGTTGTTAAHPAPPRPSSAVDGSGAGGVEDAVRRDALTPWVSRSTSEQCTAPRRAAPLLGLLDRAPRGRQPRPDAPLLRVDRRRRQCKRGCPRLRGCWSWARTRVRRPAEKVPAGRWRKVDGGAEPAGWQRRCAGHLCLHGGGAPAATPARGGGHP